jgi:hypothetical protein
MFESRFTPPEAEGWGPDQDQSDIDNTGTDEIGEAEKE